MRMLPVDRRPTGVVDPARALDRGNGEGEEQGQCRLQADPGNAEVNRRTQADEQEKASHRRFFLAIASREQSNASTLAFSRYGGNVPFVTSWGCNRGNGLKAELALAFRLLRRFKLGSVVGC
jgi:hypothetical protein